jgi:D-alanine-D-alanine ligase
LFAARQLPTPDCAWLENGRLLFSGGSGEGDWLIKTAASHASLHLDDASLLRRPDPAELERRLLRAWREFGQPFFAERFVDGREFNLGLIAGGDGSPEILPAAEIDFSRLPAGRPRIVGYAAKWDGNSEEFLATPRVFGLGGGDRALADELRRLALAVWRLLGLAGYARVDFRVDREGRPFILEANANPCLSPDAGLAAAAVRAGCGHHSLVRRIALAGLER